jgi:hypothetical protein
VAASAGEESVGFCAIKDLPIPRPLSGGVGINVAGGR